MDESDSLILCEEHGKAQETFICEHLLTVLAEPAIELARGGVVMNAFQAYIFDVVKAIYLAYPDTRKTFGSKTHQGQLLQQGGSIVSARFSRLP